MPTGRAVRIKVTRKKYTGPTIYYDYVVTMDPVKIKVMSLNEEVVWRCQGPQGTRFDVLFDRTAPDRSPFQSDTFNGAPGQPAPSGVCVRTFNKLYHYKLTVTLPTGTPIEIDPDVDVDDTPPPPRTKKTAMKGKAKKSKKGKRK